MGYYSNFELSVDNDDISIINDFVETCEGASYALNPDGSCQDVSKWYSADDDLKEFSKKYPDVLFTLDVKGEEAGDIWRLYVKNGKCQLAQIKFIFDEYDESKLK